MKPQSIANKKYRSKMTERSDVNISVSRELRDSLKNLKKDESYSVFIMRLIDLYYDSVDI